MKFSDKKFSSKFFNNGESFRDHEFVNCSFNNCIFGDNESKTRQEATKIIFKNCTVFSSDVGPAKLVDCELINLKTSDIMIFWGTLFENVKIKGDNGKLLINISTDPARRNSSTQQHYDNDRLKYYEHVNTALDISDASFQELTIRGIPVHKIKINNSSQRIIRSNQINLENLSKLEFPAKDYWIEIFEQRLSDSKDDFLVVAPSNSSFQESIEGLNYLTELGLTY